MAQQQHDSQLSGNESPGNSPDVSPLHPSFLRRNRVQVRKKTTRKKFAHTDAYVTEPYRFEVNFESHSFE